MNPRLTPNPGALHVVRWVRADGRDVRHRYYRRRTDARAFLALLLADGKDAAMFTAVTKWEATR